MILSVETELLHHEHALVSFSSSQEISVYVFSDNNRKAKKTSSSLYFSTDRLRNKYKYESLNDGDTF
jgi:hypothetical protein